MKRLLTRATLGGNGRSARHGAEVKRLRLIARLPGTSAVAAVLALLGRVLRLIGTASAVRRSAWLVGSIAAAGVIVSQKPAQATTITVTHSAYTSAYVEAQAVGNSTTKHDPHAHPAEEYLAASSFSSASVSRSTPSPFTGEQNINHTARADGSAAALAASQIPGNGSGRGNIRISGDGSAATFGRWGGQYADTYASANAYASATTMVSASEPMRIFSIWVSKSATATINGTSFGSIGSNSQVTASFTATLAGGISVSAGYGAPGPTYSVDSSGSFVGTFLWSTTGFPGDISAPLPIYNGVTMPENVAAAELTSYPVGEQGIGTSSYLYTESQVARAASVAPSTFAPLALSSNPFSLHYTTVGPLFSHFLVPQALASGDSDFFVHVAGQSYPVSAGSDFNFLAIAPAGVSEFYLTGVDAGGQGTVNDPLLVPAAFKFNSSGVAGLSLAVVPEPGTLALAAWGAFALAMVVRRRR